MSGCLVSQRLWKALFLLGVVSIASVVMQYLVVGNFYAAFPTSRRGFLIHVSRVYDLAGSDVYVTNQNHSNTVALPVKDDVFLDWDELNNVALAVFIMSAISSESSLPHAKYIIKLNGWEAHKHRRFVFRCCVLWNNNRTTTSTSPNRTYWKRSTLCATQYSCPIKGHPRDVRGVAIGFNRRKCPPNMGHYVKPFVPSKSKGASFAICAKIVYGKIDHKLLVDWIEYYRELKVDKIIMFAYNISGPALKVLKHYSLERFVEIRRFNFPWKTSKTITRDVGVKNRNAWQDEQVVVFDCYERLKTYTYVAIVDLDEFIVLKRHPNLKDFMNMVVLNRYPKAAGFTLRSYLFIKNWGKTTANNGSDLVQYYNRTAAVLTRPKNIVMPARIEEGSISTHVFKPKPGYSRVILPESIAMMHHYRYCYTNFNCKCQRIKDRSMDKMINRIRPRTTKVLQTIQGA